MQPDYNKKITVMSKVGLKHLITEEQYTTRFNWLHPEEDVELRHTSQHSQNAASATSATPAAATSATPAAATPAAATSGTPAAATSATPAAATPAAATPAAATSAAASAAATPADATTAAGTSATTPADATTAAAATSATTPAATSAASPASSTGSISAALVRRRKTLQQINTVLAFAAQADPPEYGPQSNTEPTNRIQLLKSYKKSYGRELQAHAEQYPNEWTTYVKHCVARNIINCKIGKRKRDGELEPDPLLKYVNNTNNNAPANQTVNKANCVVPFSSEEFEEELAAMFA
jgi:hypothetical protein